jgi:P22_AR N-terminal domain
MENTELRNVPFHGDVIVTFEAAGVRYVAMRRIVENMGIDWSTQRAKLSEQTAKFSCGDIPTTGLDGKTYQMLAMPVEKLPLWLASINPNKLKNEAVRAKVERYQAESAIALHDYWTKGIAVRGDLDGVMTDIGADVRKVIGGIVKGIIHKELCEIIPAMVEAQVASSQLSVVHGMTSGEAIEAAGVADRKGLRGLSRFVSIRLFRYSARKGVAVKVASLGLRNA